MYYKELQLLKITQEFKNINYHYEANKKVKFIRNKLVIIGVLEIRCGGLQNITKVSI